MQQLRKLDAGVTQKASVVSLMVGVIGVLIMGIVVGVLGLVLVCVSYPIYIKIVKREREKVAPEIIRLTDELMK